ncbi:MAG: YcxB family protein [Gammaproteobacteria bacterium]
MNIEVNIRRKDLIAFNLYVIPRLRSSWISLAVLTFGIFAYICIRSMPSSFYNFGVAAFASLVGGLAGFVVSSAISILCVLFMSGKTSGVLGAHTYTLTEVGLKEVTAYNESLQKWSGIREILKTPNYLLLRINAYLFHVSPRRAFEDDGEFAAFYETAKALRDAA